MEKKLSAEQVKIGTRVFRKYLRRDTIKARIHELGRDITMDYQHKYPLFIVVLNGAFMFAADLLRASAIECELQFVKLSSYEGTSSTGKVKEIIGLQSPIKGRHVIIVEDIVDSGHTIYSMMDDLKGLAPASVSVATLLLKPESLKYEIESSYVGFEIPDAFVIGYGLDLDGKARNLSDIYQLDIDQ